MKYHIYLIFSGTILTYFSTPMVGICAFFLYILFAWFHSCIYLAEFPIDFNTGSYCIQCKKTTGTSMEHCNVCNRCVPKEWKHSVLLHRCCPRDLKKKWLVTLKLFILWYVVITVISSLQSIFLSFLLPIHLFVLKSTYRKANKSINCNSMVDK